MVGIINRVHTQRCFTLLNMATCLEYADVQYKRAFIEWNWNSLNETNSILHEHQSTLQVPNE